MDEKSTEEWNSADNRELIDADAGRQDQNAREILRTVTIPESVVPNCSLPRMSLKIFKYENAKKHKNKPHSYPKKS
jgi:hypothetical protein